MQASVRALLDLGESQSRVADLLGIDARDVRRARSAAATSADEEPNDKGPAQEPPFEPVE